MIAFRISPLDSKDAERARSAERDDYGNALFAREQVESGAPCRHCLRRAKAGERLILFAHSPFDQLNPYKEVGAIFVHADGCERYAALDRLPDELRNPVVLRGYTASQEISRAAVVVDGDAEARLETLLADPQIAFVQARSLTNGCYYFRVDRAT
jgi:hypothetical protein